MTPLKLTFLSIKSFCEQLFLFFIFNMLFQDNIKPHLHVKIKVLILRINTHKIFKLSFIETLTCEKKIVNHEI